MKRIMKRFCLILVLVFLVSIASACGSSEVKTPSSVSTGEKESLKKVPASAESSSGKKESRPDITIEESVLFDQDGVRITSKGLNLKGSFGPEIKLLIENNNEKSVTVQARNASVNGYMVDTSMSADVAAGKKANDALSIMRSDLELAGIETIAEIEFSFHIFDSESWDTIVDSDRIRIETSAAEGFSYSFDDSGNQVYNENGVEIVVKGLSENGSWLGPSIVVYISNTGDSNYTVQVRDVSVNGFMVQSVFSCDVLAGKHAIDTITFLGNDLKENDIETIESVELSFHIFDMDNWMTSVDTSPVTIDFS